MSRIVIIGGGFTGASAAIQLLRRSRSQLDITIVEPKPDIGFGLAYSTDDPDHRLNAPTSDHFVDPLDLDEFQRWCSSTGIMTSDTNALASNGAMYVRRKDFGRFVSGKLQDAAVHSKTRSLFRHMRDVATDASENLTSIGVRTKSHGFLEADTVLVATGNAQPRLPPPFTSSMLDHRCVVGIPTDLQRLGGIPKNSRVLVVGTGLTALDVISTLIRQGHTASIVAISRRGLRPRSPRSMISQTKSTPSFLDRIEGPISPFLEALGPNPSARAVLQALRFRIDQELKLGRDWYGPFDELRDAVWQVWPSLPPQEKRRFLRQLRPWYDAHRFRTPPQNDAIVRRAEQSGLVKFQAARIESADIDESEATVHVQLRERSTAVSTHLEVDVVINCTGLDVASGSSDNPFLRSLLKRGYISHDDSKVGLAVDQQCRAIQKNGRSLRWLRILGPPTVGTFGDSIGSPFIAAHIHRVLPSIFEFLQQSEFEGAKA
jgi:uncharacterized NAD(P)/FAD-binding protein YdhS